MFSSITRWSKINVICASTSRERLHAMVSIILYNNIWWANICQCKWNENTDDTWFIFSRTSAFAVCVWWPSSFCTAKECPKNRIYMFQVLIDRSVLLFCMKNTTIEYKLIIFLKLVQGILTHLNTYLPSVLGRRLNLAGWRNIEFAI